LSGVAGRVEPHLLPALMAAEPQARARAGNRRTLGAERADLGTILASPVFERIAHASADADGRRTSALRLGDPWVMAVTGALTTTLLAVTGTTKPRPAHSPQATFSSPTQRLQWLARGATVHPVKRRAAWQRSNEMPLVHGPNVQVTFDSNPNNDRSESALVSNPRDASNLVGSSKRFTDPATYEFSLATYASFDGGLRWRQAPPLTLPEPILEETIDGISDPTVVFGDEGTAYLLGLAFHNGPVGQPADLLGIAVYQSRDKGATWSAPNVIHAGHGDDKPDIASDLSSASGYAGNVYAVWDFGPGVVFARTTDHGHSWKGLKQAGQDQPAGSLILAGGSAAAITVDGGGRVFVLAYGPDPETRLPAILCVSSGNGGDSFSDVRVAASGITPLTRQLPGGTFRVETLPAAIAGSKGSLVVTWADFREGDSRIYKKYSQDGGMKWVGPNAGEPLLGEMVASRKGLHDFHPQLAVAPSGQMACAFYEYGPMPDADLVNVILAASRDNGATFSERLTVTDRPWDPAVDAPVSRGGQTTFIGDYFGLAASALGFFPFWTDTRTGIQEIFTARVNATRTVHGYATEYNSQQHVIYLAADNHVHELVYDNNRWHHFDLNHDADRQPPDAAPGTAVHGYATEYNSQQHVIYLAADNHVHELVYDNNRWHHFDLNHDADRQPPDAAP